MWFAISDKHALNFATSSSPFDPVLSQVRHHFYSGFQGLQGVMTRETRDFTALRGSPIERFIAERDSRSPIQDSMDLLRLLEYPQMLGKTYLDHAGTTVRSTNTICGCVLTSFSAVGKESDEYLCRQHDGHPLWQPSFRA